MLAAVEADLALAFDESRDDLQVETDVLEELRQEGHRCAIAPGAVRELPFVDQVGDQGGLSVGVWCQHQRDGVRA